MIQIKFKNLEKSEFVHEVVDQRLQGLIEKFDDLLDCRMVVTLEMDNSPAQAGPDLFNVKLHILNGRYGGVIVSKSDSNLYRAIADLVDHMLEKLNRAGDKARVKERTYARKEGLSKKQRARNDSNIYEHDDF